MHQVYDPTAAKEVATLIVNKDLLRQARRLNINLSKKLEQYLIAELERLHKEEWIKDNSGILEMLDMAANAQLSVV